MCYPKENCTLLHSIDLFSITRFFLPSLCHASANSRSCGAPNQILQFNDKKMLRSAQYYSKNYSIVTILQLTKEYVTKMEFILKP